MADTLTSTTLSAKPTPASLCSRNSISRIQNTKTCQGLWDKAKEFAAAYLLDHQQCHPGCDCHPEVHCIFLNGVSSNLDLGILYQGDVNELRAALDTLLARSQTMGDSIGRIAIIMFQNDGLSTNCLALQRFFEPYQSLDIWLCVRYDDASAEHPLSDYIAAIDDWQAGTPGDSPPHALVRILVSVAINKEVLRHANTANKVLGLRPRNLIKPKAATQATALKGNAQRQDDIDSSLTWQTSESFTRATQASPFT